MGNLFKGFCKDLGEFSGLAAGLVGGVGGAIVGAGKAAFAALDGKSSDEVKEQWVNAVETGAEMGWNAGNSLGDVIHEHGGDIAKGVVTGLIVKGIAEKKDNKNKLT